MLRSSRFAAFVLVGMILIAALVLPAREARAESVPAGTLVLPFTDYGQDTDGDGLFDYLVINVTVDVTSAGFFATRANLAYPEDNRTFLDVGTQIVPTRVYGWGLFNAGLDGPYTLTIDLMNGFNLTRLDSATYTTGAYRASDFQPPAALVESLGTAWPVDLNGNGLYDELRLNYTLNVTSTASFHLQGVIWGTAGCCTNWVSYEATPAVGVGVHELTFPFPGGMLNASRLDGPYTYYVSVIQWFPTFGGSVGYTVSSKSVTTPAYSYTQFDPPWVRMVRPFSDHGVDLDGDGLFEEIVVHVPIHLDRPSEVTVSGSLGPDPLVFAIPLEPMSLPAGDASVDLVFPAFALNQAKTSGPYTVFVQMTASILPQFPQGATYTTAAYDYRQLSPVSATLGTPGWQTVDADGDGKADFLDIGVNVTASKTGDYFVRSFLTTDPFPSPEHQAGRLVHLDAGTTTNVSVRYSGVTLNRSATDGPWSDFLGVRRLDTIPGDQVYTATSSLAYARSDFQSRPHTRLNGTVRSLTRGTPDPYTIVLAADPSQEFWAWAYTDAAGNYSLDVYPGTFTLTTIVPPFPDAPIARPVSVGGPTTADLDLPAAPTDRLSWDASFSAWNVSAVATTWRHAYGNTSARISADIYGNFDGTADATELTWWIRYPFLVPFAYPAALSVGVNLGLSVDGTPLSAGPGSFVLLQGAGAYTSTEAIIGQATTTFRDSNPPAPGPGHAVDVRLLHDVPSFDFNLTLTLPAGFESTATASSNVTLIHPSAATWIVDPGPPASPSERYATATITATPVPDAQPPVAAFSAGIAERGLPISFDGSGSTDNVGVSNYTWTVAVNGTTRTTYGSSFTTIFTEIGTYAVTLTVRDGAGNTGSVTHDLTVRDTLPPPTPTGVQTALVTNSTGTSVRVSWSGVSADDLAGYRIYRSSDSGATFTTVGEAVAGATSFLDDSAVAGTTYRYRVTSVDRYGNEAPASASVSIDVPETGAAPSGGSNLILWAAVGAIVAGSAAVAALALRRRRNRPPTG